MEINESLLMAILATLGRTALPATDVLKIVAPVAGSEKQIAAYNLCDGKTSQAEIAKQANLDRGNLSRSISRWIEAGIVFRIGDDQYPLHVYPLTKGQVKSN